MPSRATAAWSVQPAKHAQLRDKHLMSEDLWDGLASKLAGTHSFGPVLCSSSMTQHRALTERIMWDVLNGHAMTCGRANTEMVLVVRVCCCAYTKTTPFPFSLGWGDF